MKKPGGSIKPQKTNSHNFLRFVAFDAALAICRDGIATNR